MRHFLSPASIEAVAQQLGVELDLRLKIADFRFEIADFEGMMSL